MANLIDHLFKVSKCFNLLINPNKCGIMNVKQHKKLISDSSLHNLPIVNEYRYLGVLIDHNGSVLP